MPRLFWIILGLIVLAALAFASMLTIGGGAVRFYRPAVSRAVPAATDPTALVLPVTGVDASTIEDSWGDPRGDGTRPHHGTDIMAARGTPVVAAAPGAVEKLFQSNLGGTTIYERSPDRHWIYYYAHLTGYAPGLHEGQAVQAGDLLGYVGDSGDAEGGPAHLHFGVERVQPDRGWWQGEAIDPYPLLARRGAAR